MTLHQFRHATPLGRRTLLGFAAAGAALGLPRPGHSATMPEAALPIQQLDDALLAAMKAGTGTPFAQRYAQLDPVISQTFDLDAALRASVGLRWESFSPAQKARLSEAFHRYTVSSYTANFDNYSGQTFRIDPDLRTAGASVIVRSYVVPKDDSPKQLAYVMRQGPGGWKAFDVLEDGTISRIAVQRSDFNMLLGTGGAPALVAGLERKVNSLNGGMPA